MAYNILLINLSAVHRLVTTLKMKQVYVIILLLVLTSAGEHKSNKKCFPDKGIKTAKISGKIESTNTTKKKRLDETMEMEYNEDGQPLYIRKTEHKTEHERKYKDGKLQLIITTRKKLPDFYLVDQFDSLIENSDYEKDTAFIFSHHEDGRPFKMKGSDGTTYIFEYIGCDQKITTTLNSNGDTLQQVQKKNKNGVLIESTWIPYFPTKSFSVTKYFGYKFNKHGHWIKRKYQRRENIITEKRRLTYY